jgi:putative endonuclease
MANKARKNLGNLGERLAAGKLTELGYRVICTNWRCEIGELDIVAWHGDCLTFIEVRTRRGLRAGTPEESITPAKRQRLQNLVEAFLYAHSELCDGSGQPPPCRIDLAAVEFEPGGKLVRLDVIENIIN